jgi:hypothetical protein
MANYQFRGDDGRHDSTRAGCEKLPVLLADRKELIPVGKMGRMFLAERHINILIGILFLQSCLLAAALIDELVVGGCCNPRRRVLRESGLRPGGQR